MSMNSRGISFSLAENVNYVSTSVDTGDFRSWEVQRNSFWSTLMRLHAGSDMLSISLRKHALKNIR